MAHCIIVNPNAGKKKGLQAADRLIRNLESEGIAYKTLVSEKPGMTLELAAGIDPSDYDAVIAVGGDGTLFEVLNGLLRGDPGMRTPVGIIPVGTGNSFIKDLGLEGPDEAVSAILGGRTRDVDVAEFSCGEGSFFFANLLGAGFVSNVAYRAKRFKNLGALSYVVGVLGELMVLKSTGIRLTIDGKTLERDAIFVEICNSQYTGGDMMMAPGALVDDGLLDVILMTRSSRWKLLTLFPSIFKGEHVLDRCIEVHRGRTVALESDLPLPLTPDGETFGSTPLEARVHPRRIRMFS